MKKMWKKVCFLGGFLLVSFFMFGCSQKKEAVMEASWATYRGEDFEVSHPESWKEKEINGVGIAVYREMKIKAVEEEEKGADAYIENVMLVKRDISASEKVDLESFKETMLAQFDTEDNYEMISCEPSKMDGKEAYTLTLKGGNEEVQFQSIQQFTIVGKYAYILAYSGDTEDYTDCLKEGKGIMESFHFIEEQPEEE